MPEPRNTDNTHEITGQVDYAIKKKYRWISESGKNTCEKCKSLDGKVFELKDLPKRPHPNCKCRVEEISIVEGSVAKLYGYRDEKFNLEIDAKEILGDLSVLKSRIDKDLNGILFYIKKYWRKFSSTILSSQLDDSTFQEIVNQKKKLLNCIQSLEIEVNRYIDCLSELDRYSDEEFFQKKSFELIHLSTRRKELFDQAEYLRLKALQLKWDERVANYEYILNAEDAGAIWKLASSKFTEGLDYIKNNGYVVNEISDLNDKELEQFIRQKLKTQISQNKNIKGVVFNEDSSLSLSIVNSNRLWTFIRENIKKLEDKRTLPNSSLNFHFFNSNINDHLTIHRADIVDIHLDDNDIIHLKIIDTIDYNFGEKEVEELRELQENGFLENYYIIVKIAVPLSDYNKNIDLENSPYYNNFEMFPRSTSY